MSLSFCVVFLVGRAVNSMTGKQQRMKPADGLSIKVSTAETLKAPKRWPASPRLKHCSPFLGGHGFASGLVAVCMFQPWTKDCVFAATGLPPLGNVQSVLILMAGMGKGALTR